jgi:hypothetical protein
MQKKLPSKLIREPISSYKPSLWVQELFRLLNSTYLHRWSSLARNRIGWLYIMREWEKDLSDYNGDEINFALERCKARKNEKGDINIFPPNSTEFRTFAEIKRQRRISEESKKDNVLEFKQKIESEAYKQFLKCLGK